MRIAMLLAASTAIAHAEPRELQAGIDAYRLGRYAEARAHLEKASLAAPKAAEPQRYLAAVARAEQRWDDCIAAARKALVLEPAGAELADTRKLHEDCRTSAGRTPYRGEGDAAAVAVTANVPGATVRIGGLTYGGTPIAPRPITVGRLAVEVDKPGWKRAQLSIETLPGVCTDVHVELEPGAEAASAPFKPRTGWLVVPREAQLVVDGIATPNAGRVELSPGVRVVELRAPGKDPWRRRVAITAEHESALVPDFVDTGPREARRTRGLVLAGGGIALGAAGVVAFYLSRTAADEARDIARIETARPAGDPTPPVRTRADFEAAVDRSKTWALVSNLAYAGAFAAGGIGAYYLVTNRAPGDDAPAFAASDGSAGARVAERGGLWIAPIAGGAVVTRSGTW